MTVSPEATDFSGMLPGGSCAICPRPQLRPTIREYRDGDIVGWGARSEADDKILARAPIFRGVEPDAMAAFRKQLRPIHFPRAEVIFAEGEPARCLYIILSGKVKIGRYSPDGRENLLSVLGPAEMLGELSIFDPAAYDVNATAVTEVRAVSMDRDTLHAWIEKRPDIAGQLLAEMAARLRHTSNDFTDYMFTDVPGRVAKQLLRLGRQFGVRERGRLRVVHDLTQDEIAGLTGSSRETVNKVLAVFARRRLIRVEGKSVVIIDADQLARRANELPPNVGQAGGLANRVPTDRTVHLRSHHPQSAVALLRMLGIHDVPVGQQKPVLSKWLTANPPSMELRISLRSNGYGSLLEHIGVLP
ncbi:cAMP-binding protein [Mycobacterium sp. JS623]|nr:cAMP-binding protein [Mycobacterium sp. JS623]